MKLKEIKLTTEDERRFLVKRMPRNYWQNAGTEITQWYICFDPPIRVREEGFHDCYLTIKIVDESGKDFHLEGNIPKLALTGLAAIRKGNKIRKIRYHISILDLDVFSAELEGLVLMEFEKKSGDGIPKIPLNFSVEEVTGDPRFRNHNLANLDSIPEEWKCKII